MISINTVRIPPQRGERKLAGGERSEPPGTRGTTIRTPAGVAGALCAPLPGRIRLLQYSGGSLRSPPAKLRLSSRRPSRAPGLVSGFLKFLRVLKARLNQDSLSCSRTRLFHQR